jgi:hypothetical protein
MIHAWKEYRHEVWAWVVKRWNGLRAKRPDPIE